jgi:hypothetical protein
MTGTRIRRRGNRAQKRNRKKVGLWVHFAEVESHNYYVEDVYYSVVVDVCVRVPRRDMIVVSGAEGKRTLQKRT